ncbi:hypothetical protein KW805_04950 [Candidatus Pacearchaeota archaeon]|nr:hypothetical protein [Candidatus Pacearchaeota archaeon]
MAGISSLYLEDRLRTFAEENPEIMRVYSGCCPEEGTPAFYIMVDGKFNHMLSKKITELDIRLARETHEYYDILQWPRDDHPESFLGDCIYDRNCF